MRHNKDILHKVIAIDLLLLCFSFCVSLTGQMFKALQEAYALSLTEGSLLLSVQSIGGVAFSLLCIFFIDALNKDKTLVILGLVMCVLLMLVGIQPPLLLLFIIFAALGFAGASVNTLTNSVMVLTVPNNTERYVNLLHFMFSLGAVTAPVLSQTIYAAYGLIGVFVLFGGFSLCCAIYAVFAFRVQMRQGLVTESLSLKKRFQQTLFVIKKPGMRLVFIITILVCSWQMSAIYYVSSFFTELRSRPMDGAIALTVFFFGMMVTRLIYTRFADRFSKGRVLMLTNGLGLLAWIGVFVVSDVYVKMALMGFSAFLCGNNMPIVFTSACAIAPKNTAAASGLVVFGYYIAILTFIPAIGAVGDVIGLSAAMVFCALPLLLVVPLSYLLYKKSITIDMCADQPQLS